MGPLCQEGRTPPGDGWEPHGSSLHIRLLSRLAIVHPASPTPRLQTLATRGREEEGNHQHAKQNNPVIIGKKSERFVCIFELLKVRSRMKTIGELPPYIRNPGKADSLCKAAAFPGTFTQWGKVPSAREHYSKPASSVSSLSPSSNPISSVTVLGMQLAFHATACSHPVLPILASDGGLCPVLAPHFSMHSLCSQHAGGVAPCNASCMHLSPCISVLHARTGRACISVHDTCIPIRCGSVLAVALWRLWRRRQDCGVVA